MSAMSELDILLREFPLVQRSYVEILAFKPRNEPVAMARKEAALLSAMIGVIDETKSMLIHAAASMNRVNRSDKFGQLNNLYTLLLNDYMHHLKVMDEQQVHEHIDLTEDWNRILYGKKD